MSIVLFLLILAILILAHEAGHFLSAKAVGVRVDEFGIGFPPKIFAKKLGETTYALNALPIGGYVKIGDGNEKPRHIQAVVIAGGILANFLLAWALFSSSLLIGPRTLPVHSAVLRGAQITLETTRATTGGLLQLLRIRNIEDLTGPVGLVKIVRDAAQLGVKYVMQLAAIISVNLAVINLLPFPALDGGHLFVLGIEAIRRKTLPPQIVSALHASGFVLLMLLMLVVTWQDIARL